MKDERETDDGEPWYEERAVYIISVAAELAGVHPQTLRIYERKGLVRPQRTSGNTRRYSEGDIERFAAIQELTQTQGMNLAGVKLIIELQAELAALCAANEELQLELRRSRRFARAQRGGGKTAAMVPAASVVWPPWEVR